MRAFNKIQSLLRQMYFFGMAVEQIKIIFLESAAISIIGPIVLVSTQCIWLARQEEIEPELRSFENILKRQYSIERSARRMNEY